MLSHLDFIIFPDRCEVIEIIPSQRYFYPIFKNASSSVLLQAESSKWRVYLNEQIRRIPCVDVAIRDPQERFISGINSFVSQTLLNNPSLDKATVVWFVKNYLHLNRHYSMQYSWLLNLARYLSPDAKINLISVDDVKTITTVNKNPWKRRDEEVIEELTNVPEQEMYNRIDQVLFNSIGNSLTFYEITKLIQTQDQTAYNQVILRAQKILSPTYAMSKT